MSAPTSVDPAGVLDHVVVGEHRTVHVDENAAAGACRRIQEWRDIREELLEGLQFSVLLLPSDLDHDDAGTDASGDVDEDRFEGLYEIQGSCGWSCCAGGRALCRGPSGRHQYDEQDGSEQLATPSP